VAPGDLPKPQPTPKVPLWLSTELAPGKIEVFSTTGLKAVLVVPSLTTSQTKEKSPPALVPLIVIQTFAVCVLYKRRKLFPGSSGVKPSLFNFQGIPCC
jgi:hypothetical protein